MEKEKIDAFAREWALDREALENYITEKNDKRAALLNLWRTADYRRWRKEKNSTLIKYRYIAAMMLDFVKNFEEEDKPC